jgi:hypothetical protein
MTPTMIERSLTDIKRFLTVLLRNVGEPAECSYCGRAVLWVLHKPDPQTKQRARAAYDPDGEIHFATCPNYRKAKHHG